MSGPIIRKYGFPNFDQIFGSREIPHGSPVGPAEDPKPDTKEASRSEAPSGEGSPPGAEATPEQKKSEDSAQL